MARPIWNGTISFGLLNVPVQLYSGERSVDLHFRMLDSRDKSPVRYERVNSETGEEVPWKEIVKGFEYSKGSYVVIDEEDLRKAAPESTETVDIEAFVDRADIDPMYFEKPYYLVPGKKAEKGYVLLREVLEKTGKIGIARVVIRTRQYLAALSARRRVDARPDALPAGDRQGRRVHAAEGHQQNPARHAAGAGHGDAADRSDDEEMGSRRLQGRVPRAAAQDHRRADRAAEGQEGACAQGGGS
jgi:hypothetical protein